jgi:hypothetical protein
MIQLKSGIVNEAHAIAKEILDSTGVPRDEQSEKLSKIQKRLEAFAKAILEQADTRPARLG